MLLEETPRTVSSAWRSSTCTCEKTSDTIITCCPLIYNCVVWHNFQETPRTASSAWRCNTCTSASTAAPPAPCTTSSGSPDPTERVKHKLHRICQPHRQVAWWHCLHCCKRRTPGDMCEPSVRMAGALRSPALPFLRLCRHTQVLPQAETSTHDATTQSTGRPTAKSTMRACTT